MYLKSLELHGFKSFPNKTTLEFERGTTVVIGPNGSGKSNISDAMRWVLGEMSTKNIRGTKMEDVIFGGTDTRRPMGFAEVSVTFDNTDPQYRIDSPYDEITVTRRYYRAGESEYLINKKPVRLKDIHELFLNTGIGREGYSVIGQGKIAEILSRKSEDRRNFFEEAAGISKFRYKKLEAERRLSDTEENMLRVGDILSELESRVGPLEKEAARARRYLELYEEKKRADISLWLYDIEKLKETIQDATAALKLSEHELELAEDTLKSLESQSDKLFEQAQENKLLSEQLFNKIKSCTEKLHRLDSEYKVAQNEETHKKALTEQYRAAEKKSDEAAAALLNEAAELNTQSRAHSDSLAKLEEALNALYRAMEECDSRAQALWEDSEQKLKEQKALENQAMDLRVRCKVLENAHQSRFGEQRKYETEAEAYRREAGQLADSAERIRKAIADYNSAQKRVEAEIDEAQKALSDIERKRNELSSLINGKKQQQAGLLQRAEALGRMEEHFEGYHASVKYVMRQYEQGNIDCKGKIYGPLSKLIATDKAYITAIETALGSSLQNIVVDDENTAKAAIRALKAADAGRATFYPLTAIRPSDETAELKEAQNHKGYIGRADELLKFDPVFADLMSYLLGRTVVFDNIDNAAEMAKAQRYRVRAVTLDGQVINAGGSFTGGSAKKDSGILSRASDIETLRQKAAELAEEIRALEKELSKIERDFKAADDQLAAHKQQKELLGTMALAEQSRLDVLNEKLAANENLQKRLADDIARIRALSESYESDITSLQSELESTEEQIETLRAYRAQKEIERNELLDNKEKQAEEAQTLKIQIAECKKDIDNTAQRILEHRQRIEAAQAERAAAAENIKRIEAELVRLADLQIEYREQARLLDDELAEYTNRRSEVEQGGLEIERRLNQLRIKIREKTGEKDLLLRTYTKNDEKVKQLLAEQDKLVAKLWEDYELTYSKAIALDYPPVTAQNRASVAAVQASCRNAIKALGPVNVGAIEEYAEVKARYDSLKHQMDDLTQAKEDLREVIKKLDEEMRASFLTAFEEINRNFRQVFSELFGGGNAEISLTDPTDVLTSGIEIKAAPPGKIIKSLMLLSGGEQAFVAIALFFAILKVNPTPFCILDEIEAALDEVNVTRFADYVKKFSHMTQFVIITHRRGTIEAADRIYGVTMPERGVSRVFALDIKEIESKKEEVANGIF